MSLNTVLSITTFNTPSERASFGRMVVQKLWDPMPRCTEAVLEPHGGVTLFTKMLHLPFSFNLSHVYILVSGGGGGEKFHCDGRIINSWQDRAASGLESAYRALQPGPAAESCHSQKQSPWQGTVLRHTGSPPSAWSSVSSTYWRRAASPAQTGGFARQALSVPSVCLSSCISRCASLSAPVCAVLCAVLCLRVRAPTPAAARFMWHACVSVNVDSVTHWASHTFQNKRLPPRITIDPCGALRCIWKERGSMQLCLSPSSTCLLRNVTCLPVWRKSVRDDLETQSANVLQWQITASCLSDMWGFRVCVRVNVCERPIETGNVKRRRGDSCTSLSLIFPLWS